VVGAVVLAPALGACASSSDVSAGRTVQAEFTVPAGATAEQTERTAAVMQARLRALGAAATDVEVNGRRLLVSGPASVRRYADAVTDRGELSFRPVLTIVSPDMPLTGDDLLTSADSTEDISYEVGPPGLVGGVESARATDQGPAGDGWVVVMSLTPEGSRALNEMAGDQYDEPPPQNAVAIVLDGRVQTAPAFQTSSFDGDVQISGGFSQPEAERLAVVLRSGAYPVPVTRVTRRTGGSA
jgi:SecD/SecF fusion protein